MSQLPEPVRPAGRGDDLENTVVGRHGSDLPGSAVTPVWPESMYRVPGYEILGRLGRGAMGTVFKARCLRLKRNVALKVLDLGCDDFADRSARFEAEAEAIARVKHPNIVEIYEVGNVQGRPYFCLELAEGGTLAVRSVAGCISPSQAAEWVRDLARAVQAAHDRGIIHRDLKPHNVLLTEGGSPKLTDFGIAKFADTSQTKTGDVIGTPAYMAPEQARGRGSQIGPATDVYGLGAILYQLLTGRAPFEGETVDVLRRVCDEEPEPIHRDGERVPRDIEVICLKCLAKSPGSRYASAAALADDLQCFLDGRNISARPAGTAERLARWCRRNPSTASLSVSLVTVFFCSFVLVTVNWRAADSARARAVREEGLARERAESLAEAHRELARREAEALLDLALLQCQGRAIEDGLVRLNEVLSDDRLAPEVARLARINRDAFRDVWLREGAVMRHRDWVWRVASSPDGTLLASASRDGTAKLWDRQTGELRTVLEHDAPVWGVAFSPDGRTLLTASGGRTDGGFESEDGPGSFRLWRSPSGEPSVTVPTPRAVYRVAFSADGSHFLTSCADHARVWHVPADGERPEPAGPELRLDGDVLAAEFSPDGTTLALGGSDADGVGQVRLFDAISGRVIGPSVGHPGRVLSLAFRPDGRYFASACLGGAVFLWDARTGERVADVPVPVNERPGAHLQCRTLAFSPDGELLAAGGGLVASVNGGGRRTLAGQLWVWDVERNRPFGQILEHPGPVWDVAFSPDGRHLATGCEDGRARLWAVGTGGRVGPDLELNGTVTSIRFTPDGSALLTSAAGDGGPGMMWSAPRSECRVEQLPRGNAPPVAAPNGSRVAVRLHDGVLIHEPGGSAERLPGGPYPRVGPFSTDGRFLALVDEHRALWRADLERRVVLPAGVSPGGYCVGVTTEGVLAYEEDGQIHSCRPGDDDPFAAIRPESGMRGPGGVSPDGGSYVQGNDGTVESWDLTEGRLRWRAGVGARVTVVAFTPDSERVALGASNGVVLLRGSRDGRRSDKSFLHPEWVASIAFDAAGRLMLTADGAGDVRLWDVGSARQLGPPLSHARIPSGLGFTSDGESFFTIGPGPVARNWPIPGS